MSSPSTPHLESARDGLPFLQAAALVFLAGNAGLVFELSSGERLSGALGGVPFATAAVLFAFALGMMGGTAIAKAQQRRTAPKTARALLVLGGALVLLAALDLALPAIGRALSGPIVAAPLLVPAIAAGLVVAVIAQLTEREREDGRRPLGTIFAVAFAGAAAGCALAIWIVLPRLGPDGGVRIAALLSAAAGVASELLAWRAPAGAADLPPTSGQTMPPRDPRPFAVTAAWLSFLAAAAVVTLVHLVFVVTSGAGHALGTALFTTSLGFALGAARAPALQARHGRRATSRALAASGFVLALTLPLWDRVPWLFAVCPSFLGSWHQEAIVHALVLSGMVALPTSWIAASIFVVRARERRTPTIGARVAAASALGATLGALVAGVLFVPAFGSQRTLGILAATFVFFALVLARGARRPLTLTVIATTALVLLVPRWDVRRMAFGLAVASREKLAWSYEEPSAGFSAIAASGVLGANGRVAVDPTWVLDERREAELGTLLAPAYGRALLGGLDLGLVDALVPYPWRAIDLRGPSPALLAAAKSSLTARTRGALADPRVTGALLRSREPYDLMLLDAPRSCLDTPPGCARAWMTGFREALTENGVAAITLPLATGRTSELSALVRAARAYFSHTALALFRTRVVVLAGKGALRVPRARLAEPAAKDDGTGALEAVIALDGALDTCVASLDQSLPLTFARLRACSSAEASAALLSP